MGGKPKRVRGRAPKRTTRACVYVAVSLDGYIAGRGDDLEWLSAHGRGRQDYGYKAFFAGVDALVMGRRTFEKALTFSEWPYGGKPVVVLTRRRLTVPRKLAGSVEVMGGAPAGVVEHLQKRGLRRLYVDGGRTIQGFLEAGLIDEVTLTVVPALLGGGVRLFGKLEKPLRLRRVRTKAFKDGLVQSTYKVLAAPRKSRPRRR